MLDSEAPFEFLEEGPVLLDALVDDACFLELAVDGVPVLPDVFVVALVVSSRMRFVRGWFGISSSLLSLSLSSSLSLSLLSSVVVLLLI